MTRARPPVWTALPSRFAGASRTRALAAIGVLLLLMLGGLVALWRGIAVAPDTLFGEAALRSGLIEGVRAGGDYYSVAESVFRIDPAAIQSWGDVPLPALATVLGALSPFMMFVAQALLVLAVFVTWFLRLRHVFARIAGMTAVGFLLAGGLVVAIDPLLGSLESLWAGLFVALSLGLWRPRRWIEAAAIALIACAFDELALLYVALMAGFALVEGQRREAMGWATVAAIAIALFVAHGAAVGDFAPAASSIAIEAQGGGYALFVQSIALATVLQLLPAPLAVVLIALALIGWASWANPTGTRVLATIALHALAIALFAPVGSAHWALLVSPVLLVGLAFAPDGCRDLAAALLDRRRVRVQRISR